MKKIDYTKFVTPSGTGVKTLFSPKVHDDGSIELIPTGKENFYDYIQSFRESVDIHTILKQCAMGDNSGLQKVQGFYADVTGMPKNNAQLLQMVMDGQKNFDKLPQEIKQRFDNDFNKFFATMDSPEWFEKMKMPVKTEKQVDQHTIETEVKE